MNILCNNVREILIIDTWKLYISKAKDFTLIKINIDMKWILKWRLMNNSYIHLREDYLEYTQTMNNRSIWYQIMISYDIHLEKTIINEMFNIREWILEEWEMMKWKILNLMILLMSLYWMIIEKSNFPWI